MSDRSEDGDSPAVGVSAGDRPDIRDLTPPELETALEEMGEPRWRARQVFKWIYQKRARGFEELTDLPKDLRRRLAERFILAPLEIQDRRRAADGAEKFLFRLRDACFVEAVLIPSGQRATLCLSTQVGCKFNCVFCASGRGGFTRQLRPGEITGQALTVAGETGREITNYVFMGMGEPLDNFDNLAAALLIMNAPEGMGVAARRLTISTAGHAPGIRRLAKLDLQVNLSLSLHAATDRLRSRLMPINRKWPLETVMEACEEYLSAGGRMMTLEYVLLGGINDSPSDAEGLAGIARRLRAKVNLIPYSPIEGLDFAAPEDDVIHVFIRRLEERRVRVTLRRSKGAEIRAACGQLAGQKKL